MKEISGMKCRLSDYVASLLVDNGVTDCFCVVGGGAMYLNDSLGHKDGLRVTYNHHEQACAIAAEAYARLENRVAVVCVTTGPGGTNAITGVVGAWLDSIPMIVISGQVRYDTTARYAQRFTDGLPLRAVGDQEYDIVKSVAPMTKYAAMIEDPKEIRYALEKGMYLATNGRPGPVWIDIPVNFQGSVIDVSELRGYDPAEDAEQFPPEVDETTIQSVIDAIRASNRPVIYAGTGIRISGGFKAFRSVVEKLNVPVVTYWSSIDAIEDDHSLYVGRGGNMGERAGNFAVQNADLLLVIGSRISIRQTGYDYKSWARAAKVIMVDIDRAEMKKPLIHVDEAIWADAKDFLEKMDAALSKEQTPLFSNAQWLNACQTWKVKYPVVQERQLQENDGYANVYAFIQSLSEMLPEDSLTAVSNGACCVVGHQAYRIKKGTRFIINNAIASMGYGLPAAIGLCVAGGGRDTICLEGDGSIMMNLQELQTIVTNNLPIKIFLINNQGYHSIRITQSNLFSEHTKVGIGPESGDLSFPSFQKIAMAFGYPYFAIHENDSISETVKNALSTPGFTFCEVFTNTKQVWEPKSSAKRLPDGTLISPPLEDLAPFLPEEELLANMFIPLIEHE